MNGLVEQLSWVSQHNGQFYPIDLQFMLAVITGYQPRDQVEALLATQLAAVHLTSMKLLSQSHSGDEWDRVQNSAAKFVRTSVSLTEALKRYRTGGEQRMIVQHVSVQDGGRAIVGSITQSSREREPEQEQAAVSRPALTDAKAAPMPIIDGTEQRVRVPVKRRQNK